MLWPLHLRGSRARLPGVQEGDTAQPGVWTLLHLGSSRPPVAPAPAVSQVWGHLQIVTWQHCCGTKIHAAEMKESAMDLQSSHQNRDTRGKSWLVWTWHAREAKREPVRHCGCCTDRLNCSPDLVYCRSCVRNQEEYSAASVIRGSQISLGSGGNPNIGEAAFPANWGTLGGLGCWGPLLSPLHWEEGVQIVFPAHCGGSGFRLRLTPLPGASYPSKSLENTQRLFTQVLYLQGSRKISVWRIKIQDFCRIIPIKL